MILHFYGEVLLKANPKLREVTLVRALVRWLDLADDDGKPRLQDYVYPEPDQPHPIGEQPQARKIAQAQADAGAMPVYALAHGYGPAADFRNRLRIAWNASRHGVWINRYGYLSDEKMQIVRDVCQG
jgi:hypothetical protein